MATIAMGLGTSHGPTWITPPEQWVRLQQGDEKNPTIDYADLLSRARPGLDEELTEEKKREKYLACQTAARTLTDVLIEISPDLIIMIGDDQHEHLLDDNMPMFCIYRGEAIPLVERSRDYVSAPRSRAGEVNGTPNIVTSVRDYPAAPEMAEHLIRSLIDDGFDIACSNRLKPEIGIGHAFAVLYKRFLPECTIPVVPLMVNTYYPPNCPPPARCYALGQSIARAIESWPAGKRVAVMASGGLSHIVLDEDLDRLTIDAMQNKDRERLCSLPVEKLRQGSSEILAWVMLAGAVERLDMTLVGYVPCYRSPAGTGHGVTFAYWTP